MFFLGGLTSYRALFSWLTPWILIPTFVIAPIVQILLFAYIGRTAGVGNDAFFLIGNAVQYAAIPCLFAMGNTICGRALPGHPAAAARLAGAADPAVPRPGAAGHRSTGSSLPCSRCIAGALLLGVARAVGPLAPLALVVAVATFSCTGLGLLTAAIALRVRESAVLSNMVFGILLIFAGVNVPLAALPAWMAAVAHWLPLTHGIAAARQVAAGRPLANHIGARGRSRTGGAVHRGRAGHAGVLRTGKPPPRHPRHRLTTRVRAGRRRAARAGR